MTAGIAELLARGAVLLDGGLGSALIARGFEAAGGLERLNLEDPAAVAAVHTGYLEAGSQVIHTNSFGGNRLALGRHGLADRVQAVNLEAARIASLARARAGAGGRALVAGDLGPSGLFLPPVGVADPVELEAAFAEQAALLESGGVDYLAIETMTDLREAHCALRGARGATSLAVSVCLSFEPRPRGWFTLMGDPLAPSLQALASAGACAVGANCSVGSAAMLAACPDMLAAVSAPVVCKPNAGLPAIEGGRPVYRQDPREFAREVAAMARAGAAAVGGCCGSDARHIAALRTELEGLV